MKHGLGWNINQPDTWSERETGKREKEGREREQGERRSDSSRWSTKEDIKKSNLLS